MSSPSSSPSTTALPLVEPPQLSEEEQKSRDESFANFKKSVASIEAQNRRRKEVLHNFMMAHIENSKLSPQHKKTIQDVIESCPEDELLSYLTLETPDFFQYLLDATKAQEEAKRAQESVGDYVPEDTVVSQYMPVHVVSRAKETRVERMKRDVKVLTRDEAEEFVLKQAILECEAEMKRSGHARGFVTCTVAKEVVKDFIEFFTSSPHRYRCEVLGGDKTFTTKVDVCL
jgi:hypothetical protein